MCLYIIFKMWYVTTADARSVESSAAFRFGRIHIFWWKRNVQKCLKSNFLSQLLHCWVYVTIFWGYDRSNFIKTQKRAWWYHWCQTHSHYQNPNTFSGNQFIGAQKNDVFLATQGQFWPYHALGETNLNSLDPKKDWQCLFKMRQSKLCEFLVKA